MFGMKLPMRLVLGVRLLDDKARTAQDFWNELAPSYEGEGQMNVLALGEHLQSMKCVGLLKVQDAYIQDGELVQSYVLTEHGRKKVEAYR